MTYQRPPGQSGRSKWSAKNSDTLNIYADPFTRFVGSGLFLSTFGWIGVYQIVTFGDAADRILGIALLAVGLIGVWLIAFRVRIVVTRSELTIVNVFRKRIVELTEIERISVQYDGTVITLKNGHRLTATAVQRWNLALFLKRRTRADDISEEIERRCFVARTTS